MRVSGEHFARLCPRGSAISAHADTMGIIGDRGVLLCGTSQGVPGFSQQGDRGEWHGFDADVCRTLAAVVPGDPIEIRHAPPSSQDRLTALRSGEADAVPRTSTWALGRDAGQGLSFPAVNYCDGQGFMARRSLGVTSLSELGGATVARPGESPASRAQPSGGGRPGSSPS